MTDLTSREKRQFPIIDPNPTFTTVLRNFHADDYNVVLTMFAGASAGSVAYLLSRGRLRRPLGIGTAAAATTGKLSSDVLGLAATTGVLSTAAFGLAYAQSRYRLMGIPFNQDIPAAMEPSYPVIDPNPSFSKVVRNFTPGDYHLINGGIGCSAVHFYYEKAMGYGKLAAATGGVLASGLFFWSYQQSRNRLRGFSPNEAIPANEKPQYPVIDRHPPFTKVVGNFNYRDYFQITGFVGFFAGFLFIYRKRGGYGPYKGVANAMMRAGLAALLIEGTSTYQNSRGRLMGLFLNDHEVAAYEKQGFKN